MRLTSLAAATFVAALTSVGSANIYGGAGGALVDNGNAVFTINVADAGVVGTFNSVSLLNLVHDWCGDVQITLTLPDSTVVSLVNRIGVPATTSGDTSNFNGNYTFADSGFTPQLDGNIWTEAALGGTSYNLRSGIYAASGAGSGAGIPLNPLIAGHSVTGAWKLTVSDLALFNSGTLGSWSLDFSVVPAPAGVAVVALSGLFAGRRRRA
ncbi:MAG: hypothetical protein U0572_09720 [Phycisphaerales bacterium]